MRILLAVCLLAVLSGCHTIEKRNAHGLIEECREIMPFPLAPAWGQAAFNNSPWVEISCKPKP
jgi:hypothetical protein